MKFAPCVLLAPLLLASTDLRAQANELAYCTTLYDLVVRYRARPIMGDNKPDPDTIIALDLCRSGNFKAGIATLDQKLRSVDIVPPPPPKP